MMLDLLIAS